MADLSLELQKLESVPAALDIIQYLYDHPAADADTICVQLGISDRRFGKANRRLITIGYIQMNGDYTYELTTRGEELAEYVAEAGGSAGGSEQSDAAQLTRKMLVALPDHLVAGQEAPLHIGFEQSDDFDFATNIVIQIKPQYATVEPDSDHLMQLDANQTVERLTVKPENYDTIRLALEVFQLSPSGDDVSACGGMYIDVPVVAEPAENTLIAYGTTLSFDTA